MTFNAFIVHWTIDGFEVLKQELARAGFVTEPVEENLRAVVPLARVDEFAVICRSRFNAPQNYIDLQYPAERLTIILFRDAMFTITSAEENAQVQAWALARGLPPEQADWATSF